MKISPINFVQSNQNFKGITKFSHREDYDDNAQEVIVDICHYDYYPFIDEPQEEFPKDNTEFKINPYPTWSTLTGKEYTIKPPLPITTKQYENLRMKSMDDDDILNIFC